VLQARRNRAIWFDCAQAWKTKPLSDTTAISGEKGVSDESTRSECATDTASKSKKDKDKDWSARIYPFHHCNHHHRHFSNFNEYKA
jgi:hypothetical protein